METHGTAVERRMGALNRVMYQHPELIQTSPTNVGNAKSRAVAAAYKAAYGTELWADIASQIDRTRASQFSTRPSGTSTTGERP